MDKEFLKGREYIQRNIVKVEENGEDFGALLKQMNSYKKEFNKLPKSTQNKLNQMELKEMVKETKKIIDEKERVLKWNREMDKKEKDKKEKDKKEMERELKWNREMDKKEKEEKEEKERVLKWNREMDKKEKEEKEKEEKEKEEKEKEEKKRPRSPSESPSKTVSTPTQLPLKKCKEGEEINPATGRCRKVCPVGTTRNEKGVCVKTAKKTTAKKCKDDEEINPATGRCRKRCPPDKIRNEKGVCVSKTKKNKN
jgi:hypothetical protein